MYPGYWLLAKGILLIAGLWWCWEVLKRFPKDVKELFGETDPTNKGIIVFFWGLTGIVATFIWNLGWSLARPILQLL